jgi:hypothetical protein
MSESVNPQGPCQPASEAPTDKTTSRQAVGSTPYASHLLGFDVGILIAALLTLLIIQSLLQPGLPTTADIPIHLYRTMEYERAWAAGVIVPRWAPNLAYGYGYPLFVFAPPLPYLLGMIFHALGLTVENALKALIILTIPLYAIGMYLLGRDLLRSVEAGLVAATAYVFAPFALREALLHGGNIPQFLTIGLFPWTLWAMARAAYARSWGWTVLAAIFYAGVLLSHLFQALIFTPVVLVFGPILFFQTNAEMRRSRNARDGLDSSTPLLPRSLAPYLPLLTIPLGLLLSAFFWLPAFIERNYTRAQADIYLVKSPFFVRYPHWSELVSWIQPLDARAANPYVPLTFGIVTLVLAGLGLLAGLIRGGGATTSDQTGSGRRRLLRPVILFFALVAAIGIFLTLAISRPIWETITILQVAEFPWRMLGLANLGLAFLAGAAMLLPPRKYRRWVTGLCLLVQLWAIAPLLYPVTPFTRYGEPTIAAQVDYERRSQSIGTTTLGEYLPQTVTRPPTTSSLVETYQTNRIPERLDYDSLPPGAIARLTEQSAVTHRYQLDSADSFTLRFFQFDYPGWQANLDGQPAPIQPEPETGLILVDVPAGQHTLTLHFGETPLRILAIALSGLTILGLLIVVITRFRRSAIWGPARVGVGNQPSAIKSARLWPGTVLVASITVLVLAGAFWLKPALRPFFTLNSPPELALPAQHRVEVEFANGIRLIGYDVSRTVVPPGGYVQVVLYWQTDAAPFKTNLQPFVHLDRLDDLTTIADATNYTPGDVTTESNLPTFHWDNSRYIRDEHDLHLPSEAEPLAYAVRVGLIDPDRGNRLIPLADGSGDTVRLTVLNVSANQQPQLTHQLDTSFRHSGETLRLTGFQLDSITPDRLNFILTWQTGQPLSTDYTVFAQLLDLDQNLVAGYDSPPVGGAYPTSTWLPNQTILDPRHIPLDQVPPGEYRLIVGLYDPTTQQRLTTPDGADFVELTSVAISEK